MASLETLIEQVRAILIQTEDKKQRHEIYNEFINECTSNKLTEEEFYKNVLSKAHKSIDWKKVEEERKNKEEVQNQLEAEFKKKETLIKNAPQYIDRLIKIAFEDGIIESKELLLIFGKADELEQDSFELANKIDGILDKLNYKSYPKADFEASTLKETLCSTNWYNQELYEQIVPKLEPIVISDPEEPINLLSIRDRLIQIYKINDSNKLFKEDIVGIYNQYKKKSLQNITNEVNNFISSNNLIAKTKLQGKTDKEKQCSTDWIIKKKVVVFPPPGCGKYLAYGILLALIGVAIYYGLPLLNNGTDYYNISSSANIRSTPNKSSTENAVAELKYGEVFKSSKSVNDGSGVIWYKSNSWFSDEYVSSKLMVNEKDFYLLESIFGDEITKNTILTFKPRKALIDYYKRQDPDYKFFGKIDDITYKKVYGKPKDFTGEWQVFCNDFVERVPNSIIYPRAYNPKSNFTDFGFIVTNVSANIKRFVLYTFDDITEEPIYVGEADATGHNLVKYVTVRSNGTLNVIFAD